MIFWGKMYEETNIIHDVINTELYIHKMLNFVFIGVRSNKN